MTDEFLENILGNCDYITIFENIMTDAQHLAQRVETAPKRRVFRAPAGTASQQTEGLCGKTGAISAGPTAAELDNYPKMI